MWQYVNWSSWYLPLTSAVSASFVCGNHNFKSCCAFLSLRACRARKQSNVSPRFNWDPVNSAKCSQASKLGSGMGRSSHTGTALKMDAEHEH